MPDRPDRIISQASAELRYQEYLNGLGQQIFETLSAAEQKRLLTAAQTELQLGQHANKYRRMPTEKFVEHLRALVETKLSRMHALPFAQWYEQWEQRADKSPH